MTLIAQSYHRVRPLGAPRGPGGKASTTADAGIATACPANRAAEPSGAAKESNLPTAGLRRPAGFEDRMGHQARAAPPRRMSGEPVLERALDGCVERVEAMEGERLGG